MNFKIRINFNLIAMVLLESWYIVPYASNKLGAVGFIILFGFWVLSANKSILLHSLTSMGYFAIWYCMVLLTMLLGLYSGSENILYYLLMSFAFAVPVLFWNYYNELSNCSVLSYLAKSIIIFSLICSVMTIMVLTTYPEAAKKIAMGDGYINDLQFFYNLGCGGFGNVYGFVVMFIPLLLYQPDNKWWKLLKNVTIIVGVVSTVMSLYTIAMYLILVSIAVYLLVAIYKKNVALGIGLTVLFVAMLVFLGEILGVLSGLISELGFGDTAVRINETIDALSGNSTGYNLNARIFKYGQSLTAFLNHPILGNQLWGGRGYGGHSTVLDELAKYGLIMYSFRVAFLKKTYTKQKKNSNYALCVPFLIYIVLAILNPTIYIYQIGFCLFFVSSILLKKESNETIRN